MEFCYCVTWKTGSLRMMGDTHWKFLSRCFFIYILDDNIFNGGIKRDNFTLDILIHMSCKFVTKDPFSNKSTLIEIMVWQRTDDEPFSGPMIPDSKVHGANIGPTWVLSAPDGPHVGPMNLAIRDALVYWGIYTSGVLDEYHCLCFQFGFVLPDMKVINIYSASVLIFH